jgi:hypothetical protein
MSANELRKGGPIGKGGTGGKSATSSPGISNTSARESVAHNSATNSQTKHSTSHKPFGELGGKGHGGSL